LDAKTLHQFTFKNVISNYVIVHNEISICKEICETVKGPYPVQNLGTV